MEIFCIIILVIILFIIIAAAGFFYWYLFLKSKSAKDDGPIGLRNTNETCYLNSMIQAIASSEKLIKQYDELIVLFEDDKLRLFTNLLKNVNESNHEIRNRNDINNDLQNLLATVNWKRTSQQDTFQLLSHFINSLQKNINDVLEKKQMTMPPKFALLHTFSEDCSYNKIQDHLALALPLVGSFTEGPGVLIDSLLDAFFEPSDIDDGTHTTTMYLYGKAPDVLILHIQANEWNNDRGEYVKPKYYIKYGEILRYVFNIQRNKDGSELDEVTEEYRLVAVVHHMGDVSGGHYITYRMHGGEWYLTNDEQVEKIDFNYDVVPYVMVYEKITL